MQNKHTYVSKPAEFLCFVNLLVHRVSCDFKGKGTSLLCQSGAHMKNFLLSIRHTVP